MTFTSPEFLKQLEPSQFQNLIDDHLINKVTRFLEE
jgi:hypothetical protein